MRDVERVLWPLVNGVRTTHLIHSFVKLGLPGLLDGGSRDVADLSVRAGVAPSTLSRLLRGLAQLNIVTYDAAGGIGLTEVGRGLVGGTEGSMSDWAVLAGELQAAAWPALPAGLRCDRPALEVATGLDLWTYLRRNPELAHRFHRSIARRSMRQAATVLEAIRIDPGSTVVDVGGGYGGLSAGILARRPDLTAVVIDQAEVLARAGEFLGELGVADRCRLLPGDLRDPPAPGAGGSRVLIFKDVLLNWSDEDAVSIMTAWRHVLPERSRVALVEPLVRDDDPWTEGVFLDLQMLALTHGRARTAAELRDILAAARFDAGDHATTTELCVFGDVTIEGRAFLVQT